MIGFGHCMPRCRLTRALGAASVMNELWGPISKSDWRDVPCIAGRPATEADVRAGTAVFYVQGDSEAAAMPLPCCAIQYREDGSEEPVVVIQAEIAPYGVNLGVRPLSGGNGICTFEEVRLLLDGFEP